MKTDAVDHGIVSFKSKYSVTETIDRLVMTLQSRDIKIFIRIDQKKEAERVGLSMRPTELLIFSDPKVGTPFMTEHPQMGTDLPLKVLAWESSRGDVYLSYNSPAYIQQRYSLPVKPFEAVEELIKQSFKR